MFETKFLDKRRKEFANSIKSFKYAYEADGAAGEEVAYQQGDANINGDIITYTLILPAVLDVTHTVTTIYLYDEAGDKAGELDGIDTTVNASQTIMIKISVTYLETGTPSDEGD